MIVELDLLSLCSIKYCADEILEREVDNTIDIVICNAGIVQPEYMVNEYGWEYHMATNYIGHFYLVNLLLPKMRAQETSSRIVMVSSRYHVNARMNINDLHFSGSSNSTTSSNSSGSSSGQTSQSSRYCPLIAYANSKLATILFARALSMRLEDTNVVAVALHPGKIFTSFRKHFIPEEVPHVYEYICMTIFQYDERTLGLIRGFDHSFLRHSSPTSRLRKGWPLLFMSVSPRKSPACLGRSLKTAPEQTMPSAKMFVHVASACSSFG